MYQEVYKMHNQVADFIVNLTSGQIDKVTAMLMMRQRRSDVERISQSSVTDEALQLSWQESQKPPAGLSRE